MQELLDWLNEKMALAPKEMLPSERGLYNGYLNTKVKVEGLIEKEKQQIIDAWDKSTAATTLEDTGEIYYNQNFKEQQP